MAIILDTNALSAFADGDPNLIQALKNDPELAIPTIVLGEYLFGIQQSRLRVAYQGWVKANLAFFNLLPIVRGTAEHYSQIRHELKAAGTPVPSNDLWIAALAREHGMPLVTRDSHFHAIRNLQILTW